MISIKIFIISTIYKKFLSLIRKIIEEIIEIITTKIKDISEKLVIFSRHTIRILPQRNNKSKYLDCLIMK